MVCVLDGRGTAPVGETEARRGRAGPKLRPSLRGRTCPPLWASETRLSVHPQPVRDGGQRGVGGGLATQVRRERVTACAPCPPSAQGHRGIGHHAQLWEGGQMGPVARSVPAVKGSLVWYRGGETRNPSRSLYPPGSRPPCPPGEGGRLMPRVLKSGRLRTLTNHGTPPGVQVATHGFRPGRALSLPPPARNA